MRNYLRMRAKGGTYFFTVNLAERRGNSLLVDRIGALRNAFRVTRAQRPFKRSWCCLTICIACGDFRKAMTIFPLAGG
ncbi:MAG TPA: hypothetical protein VGD21_01615 [Lysobacter sp.]